MDRNEHTFQIEYENVKPDVVTVVEILSVVPSKARKKREERVRLSKKGYENLIEKYLYSICDYSGKLAENIFRRENCTHKKK